MPIGDTTRRVTKAAGAASVAAPYELVTDARVRRDVDEILEAMQDAGRRVLQPRRQVPWGWIFFWGSLAGAVGAAFAVPQSRAAILRGFDRLRGRTPAETETATADAAAPLSAAA